MDIFWNHTTQNHRSLEFATLLDINFDVLTSVVNMCVDLPIVHVRMVFFSFCVVFCLDVVDLWLGSCRDSLGLCLQGSGVCQKINNHLFCDHFISDDSWLVSTI